MKRRRLTRRHLLRGAGTVAIGLPLLPELLPEARAEDGGVPCRVFTASFGLGIELAMQQEELNGPLEPFTPFAGKTAFFRNVDNGPLEAAGTPHFKSSACLFTGVPQQGDPTYHAGGPSMEIVAKTALHPGGVPNVSVAQLSAGLWSRTGAVSQFTRQWNADGSPGPRPERRPSAIFDAIFGSVEPTDPGAEPDPEELVRRHVHRSVLDTVMGQYQSLVSDRSPLGAASKARIENHLAAIRDAENRLAPVDGGSVITQDCQLPAEPTDPSGYGFYDAASGATGAGAPAVDWQVAEDAMRLIGEIMAMGVVCDLLRFGSLIMVGGGGHVRFQGSYSAIGSSLDFSAAFGDGTPHDKIFHQYDAAAIRVYQHFVLRQLTHFIAALDAVTEPNGRTALDNTLVLLGTEYGENHDPANSLHGIVGGGGRFNAGWYDQALLPSDVYHQALAAYGIDSGIPGRWPGYTPTEITGLRNQ